MFANIRNAFTIVNVNRTWAFLYLLSNLLASLAEAGGLVMVYVFFQVALSPADFGGLAVLSSIYEMLGRPAQHLFLTGLSVGVIFIFAVRSGLLILNVWMSATFRRDLQISFTRKLFRIYLSQPYAWHSQRAPAQLISAVAEHIGGIIQHLVLATIDMAGSLATIAILVATMAYIQPQQTLFAVAVLGVLCFAVLALLRGRVAIWGMRRIQASEQTYQTLRETLRGIKTLKVQGIEDFFARRVESCVNDLMSITARYSLVQQVPRIVLELVLITGVLMAVALAFGSGVPAAEVVPTMALFGASAMRILPHVSKLMQHLQSMRMFEPALKAVRGDLLELDRPAVAEVKAQDAPITTFDELELRDVSFTYDQGGHPALRGCSTRIRRGERVAIVGLSGAGKTTLADIILGLLAPTAGTIVLDGQVVTKAPLSLFSYVPQDSFIIKDSFRNNISLGLKNPSPERLRFAIDCAALGKVIDRMPLGLDTVLNDDGSNLSGGERQRMGIARAVFRDAPIMIMDEPTSALDALTEAEVTNAINRLGQERTVVVVAHRLSTIKKFDRIIFMDAGTIVAEGSFDHLYATVPPFKTMVDYLSITHES